MSDYTDEDVERVSRAISDEWLVMIKELHMSAADVARAFVSPTNYRLIRAGLSALPRQNVTVRDAAKAIADYLNATRPNGLASWRSTLFDMNWLQEVEGDAAIPAPPQQDKP